MGTGNAQSGAVVSGRRLALGMSLALIIAPALLLGQTILDSQTKVKNDAATPATDNDPIPIRQKDAAARSRSARGKLRAFYDYSFHAVPDSSAVNLDDYLVDQRFWARRPTLVVVTPVTANVLQPDEGHAEALTEALLRQIAADLGVREVHDKVSQTIGFLRKIGKKATSSDGKSEKPTRDAVEQASADQAKADKAAEPANTPADPEDRRGLRTVQLILLTDARPIWNNMSLFDRSTVVDRGLQEYLKKVPEKRQRMIEYLEPDQFRFGAFPGKESGNQMMDSLGLRRPELHFYVVDRNGEVVGDWNKFNFDAKKISAVYRALFKESTQPANE